MTGNFAEILTNSRFYVELKLDGSEEPIDGYFMECQGFTVTQDAIEISEVTPQQWGKATAGLIVRTKIPGNKKINNITLKRGLSISKTMWSWFQSVQEGNWSKQRRDGSLVVYDQSASEVVRFNFLRSWPTSYKIADLQASGSEFEIEELELVIEELIRVS
jgi:phage tail-like protein